MSCILCQQTLRGELESQEERGKTLVITKSVSRFSRNLVDVEEGFIMDVLANYSTYKTCYDIEKADMEAEEEVPSSQASKAIRKFAIEHPHNIQEKGER